MSGPIPPFHYERFSNFVFSFLAVFVQLRRYINIVAYRPVAKQ
jgi:hypothetical protein